MRPSPPPNNNSRIWGPLKLRYFESPVLQISDFVSEELNLPNNSVIHERSKKMSMHHVTYVIYFTLWKPCLSFEPFHLILRLQETVAGPTTRSAAAHVLDRAPIATFIFRYRPKGVSNKKKYTTKLNYCTSEFLRAQSILPIESGADSSRSSDNRQAPPDGVPPRERKPKRRQRDVAGPTIEIDSDDDSTEQEIRNLRVSSSVL